MRKNILRLVLMTSLATALLITGCAKEEAPEVTTPEETAHVTEDEASADEDGQEATEEEAEESTTDDAVYDPDKESIIFENFKVSLYDGFSTVKAQEYLKENIDFLSVEKADLAILALEKRLQENQNYYINQLMEEDIQNALLLAYNLEENSFSMEDYEEDNYRTFVQSVVDNGYKFFPEEGMFYPIIDYRQLQMYDKHVSDEIRSYLDIFARDSDAPSLTDTDLGMMAEELTNRIVLTENHLQAYPEGQTFDKVYGAFEMYLTFYTSSLAYMGGFDADSKELNEDIKASYLAFVEANADTAAAGVINDYLDILKGHNYTVDGHVYDFLQDINSSIVKHISSVTTK